mgnify:FL=1|tara:strand:+ start:199 stop:819 length:621 start_codon:yes stop_codon:yes gene_type:complete
MVKMFCINLKQRTDRLSYINNHIDSISTKIDLEIIEGIHDNNGMIGAGLSHQKCIKTAMAQNLNNIIIIEDDISLKDNVLDLLELAMNDLPSEWDVLLGVPSKFLNNQKCVKITKNLFKIEDFSGLIFGIYNKKVYGKLLEWDKKTHYDRYIGKLAANGIINVYCCCPFLGNQIPGFSNVRNKGINDCQMIRDTENVLIQLVNNDS